MKTPAVAGVDAMTSRSRVANGRMKRSAPISRTATPAAIPHLRIEPREGQAEGTQLKQDPETEDDRRKSELVAPPHRRDQERDGQPEHARERQQVAAELPQREVLTEVDLASIRAAARGHELDRGGDPEHEHSGAHPGPASADRRPMPPPRKPEREQRDRQQRQAASMGEHGSDRDQD